MTIKDTALKLAGLINDEGHAPSEACAMLGLEEGVDVFSEDSSCIELDDRENELVDLGWHTTEQGLLLYVLHRTWADARYVWEVHETHQLTNHAKDPSFER